MLKGQIINDSNNFVGGVSRDLSVKNNKLFGSRRSQGDAYEAGSNNPTTGLNKKLGTLKNS